MICEILAGLSWVALVFGALDVALALVTMRFFELEAQYRARWGRDWRWVQYQYDGAARNWKRPK